MKTEKGTAIEQEEAKANAKIDEVCGLLKESGHGSICRLLKAAYENALPALKDGRHMNPIHHTPQVVEFLVRILLAETDMEPDTLKRAIVTAVFHDSGNAYEPKSEKKIRKKDVDADPSLREPGIEQRRRHMRNSVSLLEGFMSLQIEPTFTPDEISEVKWIIGHHDDPTIAELLGGKESAAYLFGPALEPRVRLAVIHREADRLWMLSKEGIVTDLKRKKKPWYPPAQITHNVIRHWEERKLYEEALPDKIEEIGFDAFSAFYRTKGGKRLFAKLQEDTRRISTQEWHALTEEACVQMTDAIPHEK